MIGKTLKQERFDTHELFKPEDFTHHEYARGNRLVVAVCKRCGKAEVELYKEWCK